MEFDKYFIVTRENSRLSRQCILCQDAGIQWTSSVATNCKIHLSSKHNITINKSHDSESSSTVELPRPTTELTKDAVHDAVCNLIVGLSLPISLVEMDEFKEMCAILRPGITELLPSHKSTVRAHVISKWIALKGSIINSLREMTSRVHISLDVWTSPDNLLFIAFVAHFVRRESVEQRLLGLRPIAGHSGQEKFNSLRPILEEYDIVHQLGAIIGDNAATNDTLAVEIERYMMDEHKIDWSATSNRTRCIGHILNLIVQSFLFSSGLKITDYAKLDDIEFQKPSAEEDETSAVRKNARSSLHEGIRTMGALGKLHNIVVHIRSSAPRQADYLSQASRLIPLDNRTCWNSWYNMLEAALSAEIYISNYVSKYIKSDKNDSGLILEPLLQADWEVLRNTHSFLQFFFSLTKENEGHQDDISKTIPTLAIVKKKIDVFKRQQEVTKKARTASHKAYLHGLNQCEIAWQKWWTKISSHPLYLTATILHPNFRTSFMKVLSSEIHDKSFEAKALPLIRQYWDDWKTSTIHDQQEERDRRVRQQTIQRIEELKQKSNDIYALSQMILPDWTVDDRLSSDELSNWLKEPAIKSTKELNPLKWWLENSQQDRWPVLSKLALSIFSVPAMSAEPEIVFSTSRRTISWTRAGLQPDIIEALECINHYNSREASSEVQRDD